jgi:hypothetical protein
VTAVPRSHLVRFAQLAALWAYSVSQPVFSFLGGNDEFLVLRGTELAEAIVFGLVVAFGPPLLAVGYAAATSLVSRWVGDMIFLAALVAFFIPFAFQLVKPLEPGRALALLLVAALCALAAVLYTRLRPLRLFLTASVVLPVVSLAWFLMGVPTLTDEARAAAVDIDTRRPVVVVVLDELSTSSLTTRAGEVDAVRYPTFGRLAREATWYPNATSVHQTTSSAVPSILTGNMPRPDTLPTLADHPRNLFTLLGASYDVHAREAMTRLCPKSHCPRTQGSTMSRIEALVADVRPSYLVKVLPYSITGGAPGLLPADNFFERAAGATVGEYESFLGELTPGQPAATLHYMHLLLPHHPWSYLPSGRRYEHGRAQGLDWREVWLDDRWVVQQALQRQLLQLEYTDALLGRLVSRLEQLGIYDDALVVVVADHGASFRPGLEFRHVRRENFAEIAGVPLFVKYPGQTDGVVDRRAARTIDVLPTIAEVLGIRLPWDVDGASLRGPAPRRAFAATMGAEDRFVQVPVRAFEAETAEVRRRNTDWFGEGQDSLYAIGEHRELLGARVGDDSPRSDTVSVRLEDAEALADVRTSSSFVPARIAGVVDAGEIDEATELAVAVNGRVRALTRCIVDDGQQVFTALVPESAFRDGRNRVDVYAIEETAGPTRLVRLGGSG